MTVRSRAKSTLNQVLRALEPTPLSAAGSFFVASTIVVSQLLYISLQYGTILPGVFDGQLATTYTNYIVGPLYRVVHVQFTDHLAVVVIWALGGLLAYEFVTYIYHEFREWQQAAKKQVFFQPRELIKRQLLSQLAARIGWRVGVIAVGLASLWVLVPVVRYAYVAETQVTVNLPGVQLLGAVGSAVALWTLVIHWCLVLLRLYLFRTRLLADEEVYRS